MEGNSNGKASETGEEDSLANNANDWRSQHHPNLRKIVLFKIVDKLKTYFPDRGQDEINSRALKFEDKVYGIALSKDDYLRKIAQKMSMMEQRSKNAQPNNVQSGSSVNGTDPLDPAGQVMNQVPTSLLYTQTQTSQQWLPQNIQSNHNIHVSSSVPTTISAAQNLNVRKQLLPQQQQQPHGSTYMVQQHQMSHQLPKENIGHGNLWSPYMQQHAQLSQQQHHLLKNPIQQQLPHQQSPSFPHSSSLSSLPSPGQQKSQFLPTSHFPTQRVHPSHQQQMDVSSLEQNHMVNVPNTQQHHLTPRLNNGEQRAFSVSFSQQNNTASFQAMAQQNHNFQRLSPVFPSQQQQNMHDNFSVPGSSLLGTQGQKVGQSQPMMLQQYQPQHALQQQKPENRILQQHLDDTNRFRSLLQIQNIADQKNHPHQLQIASPSNPSTSQDSTGKTVHTSGVNWQEETYQKIKALREKHVAILITMLRKVTDKLRKIDSLPQQNTQCEVTERLRAVKSTVAQLILFLNVSLSNITDKHRDRFSEYEEHILRLSKAQTRTQGPMQHLQQQEGGQVHVSHSIDNDQMTSRLMPSHQNVASSSVSGLTISQTAMPSMLQTRPNVEPKDENNIIPSLKPLQSNQQVQMPKNEMNDVKVRQRTNNTAGFLRRQVPKPLVSSQARISNFTPSATSPQIHHQSSPPTVNKTKASLQSCGSPFVAPSPVTSFAPPSPVPGDPEKPITVESPVSHACQIQTEAQPPSSFGVSQEQPPEPITERPIDRLIKAIQSASPKALAESVSEMSSIISIADRVAGSVRSSEGFRAYLAEDLSARTKSCLHQGETYPANKRFKRSLTALPLNIMSQTYSYKPFCSLESEVDSTASSGSKDDNIEPDLALLQEIKEINRRFIETEVNICNEDVYPSEVASRGTIVTCSYTPVSLCATLKAHYKLGHISQIQPLRVLVPADYPYSSPILLERIDPSGYRYDDLSVGARTRFSLSMREVSAPISLKDIAQAWNDCARATMAEYAERHGGGTFSSKYGHWETILRAS